MVKAELKLYQGRWVAECFTCHQFRDSLHSSLPAISEWADAHNTDKHASF